MTVNELKAAYANFPGKLPPTKKIKSNPTSPAPVKPGDFTENERGILLLAVADCLKQKGVSFNPWWKHGLPRLYFPDGSFLGYGPKGTILTDRGRAGIAYRIVKELDLRPATREIA